MAMIMVNMKKIELNNGIRSFCVPYSIATNKGMHLVLLCCGVFHVKLFHFDLTACLQSNGLVKASNEVILNDLKNMIDKDKNGNKANSSSCRLSNAHKVTIWENPFMLPYGLEYIMRLRDCEGLVAHHPICSLEEQRWAKSFSQPITTQ